MPAPECVPILAVLIVTVCFYVFVFNISDNDNELILSGFRRDKIGEVIHGDPQTDGPLDFRDKSIKTNICDF